MLALAISRDGISWAVADPWEVRGAGSCTCRARSRHAALLRLVRREKPTAIVTREPGLRPVTDRVARIARLPVVQNALPMLTEVAAREFFPELRVRAPTDLLVRLAVLAIRAVLHGRITRRPYANRHPRHHDR